MNDDTDNIRLLVCISFLFRHSRMPFLFQVVQTLADLRVGKLDIIIFTETDDPQDIACLERMLHKLCDTNMTVEISIHPEVKANLRMLPWAHKKRVRETFEVDNCAYTHLLYLEEDIRFGPKNLAYFLDYNAALRQIGLIPGFLRVEFSERKSDICVSDTPHQNGFAARAVTQIGDLSFVCLDEPYTGMYMLDADQAREYIQSKSFLFEESEKIIAWGEPERAAIGLTFENPPAPHRWRLVIPVIGVSHTPHVCCWLHHLPNNYANNYKPDGNFRMGKTRIDEMFV